MFDHKVHEHLLSVDMNYFCINYELSYSHSIYISSGARDYEYAFCGKNSIEICHSICTRMKNIRHHCLFTIYNASLQTIHFSWYHYFSVQIRVLIIKGVMKCNQFRATYIWRRWHWNIAKFERKHHWVF